jgi:hypothetical protein
MRLRCGISVVKRPHTTRPGPVAKRARPAAARSFPIGFIIRGVSSFSSFAHRRHLDRSLAELSCEASWRDHCIWSRHRWPPAHPGSENPDPGHPLIQGSLRSGRKKRARLGKNSLFEVHSKMVRDPSAACCHPGCKQAIRSPRNRFTRCKADWDRPCLDMGQSRRVFVEGRCN